MASNVTVDILGDAASLRRALGDAQSSLDQFAAKAQSVGERATSIGRSMTFGVTLPLVGLGKVALDELTQSSAASAQTEAAIRSTGGAAHVTAAQIDQLSAALLRKSGIDDETIKGGANVLLTFKAVRNEAGAGNDIFTQATQSALDLSVALGKDMTSSAILVGKALQDPIQGVSALRRVGVQLTDAQVEQIKQFMATGDVMSAQKVILGELKSEVGGSADAYGNSFAGKVSKAREELKNSSAEILSTAVPVMQDLSDVAQGAADVMQSLPAPVQEGVVAVGALVAAAGPAAYVFGALSKAVSGAASVAKTLGDSYVYARGKLLEMNEAGTLAAVGGTGLLIGGLLGAGLAAYTLADALDSGKGSMSAWEGVAQKWANTTINAAKSSGDEYLALKNTVAGLRSENDHLVNQYPQLKSVTFEADAEAGRLGSTLEGVAERYVLNKDKIEQLNPRLAELKKQHDDAKAAAEAHKAAVHDLATGTTDLTTATEDAKQAIYELQSATLAAAGGELGLQQANLNLTKAQQDYTDALNSGDPTKIADAELNLQQARLGVAQATDNAADSQQKLHDLVGQGWDVVNAEIAKKREEIRVYGDSSGAIQDQIDKLFWLSLSINGLPPQKGTKVYVEGTPEAQAAIDELHRQLEVLTGQPWPVIVQVTSEFDNLQGLPGGP